MEEININSSEKNISDKWLDNIFNILKRLEESEKLAREGCLTILEYVQIPEKSLPLIQYKNYTLFLTDFQLLINNCQQMIGKKDYDLFIKNLKGLKELESKCKCFLGVKKDHIKRTETYYLKPMFHRSIDIIGKMRRDLITNLWKILSPSADENMDSLPK